MTSEEPRRRLEAATWLGKERRRRGVLSRKLAEQLDVERGALSTYETGRSRPPDWFATRLAEVWDLDELYVRRQLGLWTPSEGTPVVRPGDVDSSEDVPDNVIVLPLAPGARITDEQRELLEVMIRQMTRTTQEAPRE